MWIIGSVSSAFSALDQKVMEMVAKVRAYINKLNDIALRPNPLSDEEYIEVLIEGERNEMKESMVGKGECNCLRK